MATPEIRFWKKVDLLKDRCWLWKGYIAPDGYGRFGASKEQSRMAHRFSYELHKGPIPEGKQLDHLCRNRSCVNPDHLEAVTQKENLLRGTGSPAVNARKTHCPRGHALTEGNIYRRPDGKPYRECKRCHKMTKQRREAAAEPAVAEAVEVRM